MTNDQTTERAAQPSARVIGGRYVLLAELGRGGMGVVWRAEDRVIGRHVAIKELSIGGDEVSAERIMREVRTGGRLNDPAVVTVYDVVSEDGGSYIVMELVEAPTLADVVRHNGPMPPAQAASIGRQVLSALQAAHDAGIVHRDVKPGNIMVAPNGRVKLTDFGIAQAVDDPRLTTSGMIVGSPAFMAPERVAGNDAVPASDIWSLGATLFFAVEGILAFERPTTAATLHAIMNEVPYLTRTQGPLASAIMGMLIASPDARISAAQAHQLLAMAAATASPPATPPGGQTVLWPQPVTGPVPAKTGHRGIWTIAAAVLGVVLLGGGFLLGQWWAAPGTDKTMLPTVTYGVGGGTLAAFSPSGSYSCYNGQIAQGYRISSDNSLDCDKPHDLEVYDKIEALGNTSYTDDEAKPAGYPGTEALQRFGESFCGMSFGSDTVSAAQRPLLSHRALVPAQGEWTEDTGTGKAPNRTVYCVATRTGGAQLTGSVVTKVK
ncbi:serine/threonine protein kinase [Amycolatopsis sp. K13G38]|uniref:non-specific serine/threonine protein kinase n=1 Tax=Amycolatopsis acididurans TaxID=2724524 RepID=A0ABX1JKE8_9PSEU|nr:serine/threonine-protein kinase [Amycolatopsis acididurans]NKQ58732.1 serine/threonine protein kinase [Amycolatopsis acididurans]